MYVRRQCFYATYFTKIVKKRKHQQEATTPNNAKRKEVLINSIPCTMASKTGMFLRDEERVSLIQELKNKGEIKPGAVPEAILESASKLDSVPAEASFGTGCLTCGEDNDHANLLLCEGCNDEYHTYCLDPPLRAVPTGDWFCGK